MSASVPGRYASVDALRGCTVAAMLLVNTPGDWGHVYAPLLHAYWDGCTFADLVFPFFLFVVGVSLALGLAPRAQDPAQRPALMRGVLLRGTRIVILGLALHALAWWALDLAYPRPWGVLQRIGLCFALAGLAALWLRPRAQWGLLFGLLAGYAAVLAWGGTAPWTNPASRLDTFLFAPWLYRYDTATGLGHDPEGLLSTVGALASTVCGLRAGAWLRAGRTELMLASGAVALFAGAALGAWQPINKNLWTPAYVLWTGGLAVWALAAAHVLVDRRGWPEWGRRFGVNAIVAYAGSIASVLLLIAVGAWQPLYAQGFASWLVPWIGPTASSLVFALAFVGAWWCVVWWMDRRGWIVKI